MIGNKQNAPNPQLPGYIAQAADGSGAFSPLGRAAAELYGEFNENGHGSEDFSAIIRYLRANEA